MEIAKQLERVREMYLSPSSIITFNCPRRFWYKYIEKIPEKITVHLIKGSAVHNTIDKLIKGTKFLKKNYNTDLKKQALKILDKEFDFRDLDLTKDEEAYHYLDAENIIKLFVDRLTTQVKNLIDSKKVDNPTHAFHLLKPKFSEYKLKDDTLKVRGIIDAIQKDFDDKIVICDYKTSSKYKNTLSSDYEFQLAVYAYLYYKNEGILPDWLCINYLRYGESFYIKFTQDLINEAVNRINNVRIFIRTHSKKEEYFKKVTKLCEYCTHYENCFGKRIKVEKTIEEEVKKDDQQSRLSV